MVTRRPAVAGFTVLLIFAWASWTPTLAEEEKLEEPDCTKCIQKKNPESSCPRATIPNLITTEHYYLELSFKANWYKAHQYCALHGMRLATIQSEEQEMEMENLMAKHNLIHVWIGVTDLAEKDKYYNVHNGVYVNYTKWLPGQPDKWRPEERCVHVWKPNAIFGWNDGRCEDVDWFACDLLDTYCP